MISFLDCEASGLDETLSYPIEVGWSSLNKRGHESYLIIPHEDWTWWDRDAQEIHGISRNQLFKEGKGGPWLVKRLCEALSGHKVYADSEMDIIWLNKLFAACGIVMPFKIYNAVSLIEATALKNCANLKGAREWAHSRRSVAHRAGPDAEFLRDIYMACSRRSR